MTALATASRSGVKLTNVVDAAQFEPFGAAFRPHKGAVLALAWGVGGSAAPIRARVLCRVSRQPSRADELVTCGGQDDYAVVSAPDGTRRHKLAQPVTAAAAPKTPTTPAADGAAQVAWPRARRAPARARSLTDAAPPEPTALRDVERQRRADRRRRGVGRRDRLERGAPGDALVACA